MTNNATQKNLIQTLIQTHHEPAKAFQIAIQQAKTPEQAEQLKKIAKAFKIMPFSFSDAVLFIKVQEWDTPIKQINFTQKTHTNREADSQELKKEITIYRKHNNKIISDADIITLSQVDFYLLCEWLDANNFKYVN